MGDGIPGIEELSRACNTEVLGDLRSPSDEARRRASDVFALLTSSCVVVSLSALFCQHFRFDSALAVPIFGVLWILALLSGGGVPAFVFSAAFSVAAGAAAHWVVVDVLKASTPYTLMVVMPTACVVFAELSIALAATADRPLIFKTCVMLGTSTSCLFTLILYFAVLPSASSVMGTLVLCFLFTLYTIAFMQVELYHAERSLSKSSAFMDALAFPVIFLPI